MDATNAVWAVILVFVEVSEKIDMSSPLEFVLTELKSHLKKICVGSSPETFVRWKDKRSLTSGWSRFFYCENHKPFHWFIVTNWLFK